MVNLPQPALDKHSHNRRKRHAGWTLRLTPVGITLFVSLNLIVFTAISLTLMKARSSNAIGSEQEVVVNPTQPPTSTATPTSSPVPSQTAEPESHSQTPTIQKDPNGLISLAEDSFVLSLGDGGYYHLFAYQPMASQDGAALPLTRLTFGDWEDITPALSPDGSQIIFSSNRDGFWDLYLLDLATGEVTRLTDSPEYDGAPSWSPDGEWLAYETYVNDNLEIVIRDLAGEQTPIFLTENPAADFSPAWSPNGRQIAFVSNRSGENEIWLADLDKVDDDRYANLSRDPEAREIHPVWSPDGRVLAWASSEDGYDNLYALSLDHLEEGPSYLGSGCWPLWSLDGESVYSLSLTPYDTYLAAYPIHAAGLILPPIALPGPISGLTSGKITLPQPLPEALQQAVDSEPEPNYSTLITPLADAPSGRQDLVPLDGVQAPYAMLQDAADESFQALRARLAGEIGWDFLANLQNAYVPLTTYLEPGLEDDWLYTGRAFAFDPLPLYAGWSLVVREDYGPQTYWRVYIKARLQDGSQGIPLHDQPWDLVNRQNEGTAEYETGGKRIQELPAGYWIDFTQLAARYGWKRQPALPAWRYNFPSIRFNEYVFTEGLDWNQAMLELYPPEVLQSPTPIIPPTHVPTRTPWGYQAPVPTAEATKTPTPTWNVPMGNNNQPVPTVVPVFPSSYPSDSTTPDTASYPPQPGGLGPISFTDNAQASKVYPNLEALFVDPISSPGADRRPPLNPVPWSLGPFDHFYFIRPIASYETYWIQADYRYGGTFFEGIVHTGVDIPARKSTPVLAAGSGRVTWAGYGLYRGAYDITDPYGQAIAIYHDFGYQQQGIYSVYGHLDSIDVVVGQYVNAGEVIGLSGDTGKVTGPHLHFEVRVGKSNFFTTRNPEMWIVPPEGWGVLVARIMSTGGLLIPELPIVVRSQTTGQAWFANTYGKEAVNSDPYYRENLVVGDLPAGQYEVRFPYAGVTNRTFIQIRPGRITYLTYQGRKGFNTEYPAVPGANFQP